ncbi:hypothetical protein SAMN04487897_1466 [Paenibacillus sp. yr247]|uniref:hypothetical protein n=1 Tax=Paenibacillus sp. yr247 TaxID=1761880 RepID=UPI00088B824E|nr:hypothetical protein [Paenibacillus sp. yr247]SDP19912.1 hypothetical protein SAMN04487897_1466 [Paenibacillus sp. yr247]
MFVFIHWIGFVLGLVIVISTIGSIVDTLIVTRSVESRITLVSWEITRFVFKLLSFRTALYEKKDRLLSFRGPASLLTTLALWIFLFVVGYALLFWPFTEGTFVMALRLSGSSFFTLGIFSAPAGVSTILEFAAAATGMITIALQIGYLPTIYSSYNKREALVTALSIRVRRIAWGPNILKHHFKENEMSTMPTLFAAWEMWAADITESHVSHPWLMVFRSPHRMNSWVTSLLSVIDAANLYLILNPSQAPAEARQCLRAGITCFQTISDSMGFTDELSRATAPQEVRLSFEEFLYGLQYLEHGGFPIEISKEEAWNEFRTIRAKYELPAYELADFVFAVPAPWSGTRDKMTPETILPTIPLPNKI